MMIHLTLAGLMLGAPGAADVHRGQVDHRGDAVEVTYRSHVALETKQIGSPAPGGRPATLRCDWRATVSVHREAVSPRGHVLARTVGRDTPLSGTRAGWCATQRDAIAATVAARGETIRDHVIQVAADDRGRVVAELDAAHDRVRG